MTLHFMHIGKTGGTAIKRSLRDARCAYWHDRGRHKVPETPYGPIKLEPHRFKLRDLPEGDHVFFCLRDPIARFVSAFYSRHGQGGPGYSHRFEWSPDERRIFERFSTAQQLAMALVSGRDDEREFAQWAMRHIRHTGLQRRFTGTDAHLRLHLGQIAYVARQETLAADWEQMKSLFGLPPDLELPSDPARAHRRDTSQDAPLDKPAIRALREWYARDYRLLDFVDELRAERGWGPDARRAALSRKLRRRVVRVRALVANAPARPASR